MRLLLRNVSVPSKYVLESHPLVKGTSMEASFDAMIASLTDETLRDKKLLEHRQARRTRDGLHINLAQVHHCLH